jgi:hypothetical protein
VPKPSHERREPPGKLVPPIRHARAPKSERESSLEPG